MDAHPHGTPDQQLRYRISMLKWDRDELDIWRPHGWRDQTAKLQAEIDHLETLLTA